MVGWRGGTSDPLVTPHVALLVGLERPGRKFRITVSSSGYLEEPSPEIKAFPCHPDSVDLCRMSHKHATWITLYYHHLGIIGVESHTVEDIHRLGINIVKLICKDILDFEIVSYYLMSSTIKDIC